MVKFQDLLSLRLKTSKKEKMTALAKRANKGSLSSFSGVFKVSSLNDHEKENLSNILNSYKENKADVKNDLQELITITAEVKAITNQAVMLHGERVKKAQNILKNYKEGAFTAWLFSTYGNRQTPYNFLQYYEFYTSMPPALQPSIDKMPRQAIYTLASREGKISKKQEIVKNYKGEAKQELLSVIRKLFPLKMDDKRQQNIANQTISSLKKLKSLFSHPLFMPDEEQKETIERLIKNIKKHLAQK